MKTDDTREETFARKWGKGGNASSSQKRQHLTKIVATTTTYLDVRDRINRGDARGRAKRGIDGSIHVCILSARAGKKMWRSKGVGKCEKSPQKRGKKSAKKNRNVLS
jgi:hypothetical protein